MIQKQVMRLRKQGEERLEDHQLVERSAQGDQEAFGSLYAKYRTYVYTLAWRVVLDEEIARDVVQEVFARVGQRIAEFNGSGSFKSWLSTIAIRMAIDQTRTPTRREIATDPAAFDTLSRADGPDPRTRLDQNLRWSRICGAMETLSPQQRAILFLRLTEDLGPKAIADRLELPAQQVRSQMHRALVRLKEKLGGEPE